MQVSNETFFSNIQRLVGTKVLTALTSEQPPSANRNLQITNTLYLVYSFYLGQLASQKHHGRQTKMVLHALDNVHYLHNYALLTVYNQNDVTHTNGADRKVALSLYTDNCRRVAKYRIICWRDLQSIITDSQQKSR